MFLICIQMGYKINEILVILYQMRFYLSDNLDFYLNNLKVKSLTLDGA